MRRLRFNAAVTLDGFIADPNGGYDWIIMDAAIDFAALYSEFDTLVMGRKTYEVTRNADDGGLWRGMRIVVFSHTLDPAAHPNVTISRGPVPEVVRGLKAETGKDIWLFGGGILLRELLDAGLVDTLELAVMPVMITEGIPLLPRGKQSPALRLTSTKPLPSGIVFLNYEVANPEP